MMVNHRSPASSLDLWKQNSHASNCGPGKCRDSSITTSKLYERKLRSNRHEFHWQEDINNIDVGFTLHDNQIFQFPFDTTFNHLVMHAK
jgi:hypothetical protein